MSQDPAQVAPEVEDKPAVRTNPYLGATFEHVYTFAGDVDNTKSETASAFIQHGLKLFDAMMRGQVYHVLLCTADANSGLQQYQVYRSTNAEDRKLSSMTQEKVTEFLVDDKRKLICFHLESGLQASFPVNFEMSDKFVPLHPLLKFKGGLRKVRIVKPYSNAEISAYKQKLFAGVTLKIGATIKTEVKIRLYETPPVFEW